jgi:hypothetical protein
MEQKNRINKNAWKSWSWDFQKIFIKSSCFKECIKQVRWDVGKILELKKCNK